MRKYIIICFLLNLSFAIAWGQADNDGYSDTLDAPLIQALEETAEEAAEEAIVEDVEENYESYSTKAKDYEPELRQLPHEAWDSIKKDERFQYKKKKPEPPKPPRERNELDWFDGLADFFNSAFIKFLLYLFVAAFIIYIVYLFIKNNDISFRRNVQDETIKQEDPWEDVHQFDDWELALKKALNKGDYRLATRIYYLQTLQLLDQGGQVKYREDKTNWYYVQKLFGNSLHDDFKGLTQSFDYIWYGEYQVDENQFALLETQFKNFHNRIY